MRNGYARPYFGAGGPSESATSRRLPRWTAGHSDSGRIATLGVLHSGSISFGQCDLVSLGFHASDPLAPEAGYAVTCSAVRYGLGSRAVSAPSTSNDTPET